MFVRWHSRKRNRPYIGPPAGQVRVAGRIARDNHGRPLAHQKRENEAIQLEVQRTIGKRLRLGFDDVLKEALPPHLEDVLRQLDEQSN
jgi:hypothetical protein